MRKFFSFFAALLFAGSMMAAEPYTLKFNYYNSTSGDKNAPETALSGLFDEASMAYVDDAFNGTLLNNVYLGRKYKDQGGDSIFSNIKFGASKKGGSLKFALKNMNVDSVVFRAAMYGATEGGTGFTVNGTQFTLSAGNKVFENVTYVPAEAINALEIIQSKDTSGRFYMTSITVYPGEGAPVGTPKYYVAGSMNGWQEVVGNAAWELKANPSAGDYRGEFTFNAKDSLKVIGVVGNTLTWYPDPGQNYGVAESGDYDVIFYPEGNTLFDNGYFTLVKKEPVVILPQNCAEIYAKAKGDQAALKDVIVTYVSGKNVWVRDAEPDKGSLLLYLSANATWNVGDTLSNVAGEVDIYQDIVYELKPSADQVAAVTAKAGAALAPETLDALTTGDVNRYIVLKGVSVVGEFTTASATNLNMVLGEDTIVLRNNFKLAYTFAEGKLYDVVGVVSAYKGAIQVYFIEAAEAAPVVEPTYTAAGAPTSLFGTEWDPTNVANDLAPITGSKYLYAWKKENVALAAGKIEFKVCEDHAWTKAWPAKNYELALAEEGLYDIAIFFNPEFGDSAVYAVAEFKGSVVVLPTIMLHGNFTGTWADTKAFTPSADSTYASLELALAEGTYEFGFKFDGTWKANGAQLTREANTTNLAEGSGNMFVTADVPGNYIFTYTYATQDVVVTYPNPIVADTIDVVMGVGLIYVDAVAQKGWWEMYGNDGKFAIELSNGNTITEAPGVYTAADLDPGYSWIVNLGVNKTDTIGFVDGSITLAVDDNNTVTIVGKLVGEDGNIYNMNLTYNDPKADVTVNVTVSNGTLIDKYAAYGLYGVYGYADDNSAYVQLGIWAEEGFQGNFTEDDLDNKYIGSGVVVAAGAQTIYSAAIEVIPGDAEGNYLITADILCYNNTLYKVTMTIGEAQGLEGVDAAVKAIKRLVNGQLVIEKAGKTYNAAGNLVR